MYTSHKVIQTIWVQRIAHPLHYLDITITFGRDSNCNIPITKLPFKVLIYPWKVLQKIFSWKSPSGTWIVNPLNELYDAQVNFGVPMCLLKSL